MAQIAVIRETYPRDELYYVRLAEMDFVLRTITPNEYTTIKEIAVTSYDIEDLVAQTAVIYPSTYNSLLGYAGVPKMLSRLILQASLLSDDSRSDVLDRTIYYNHQLATNIDAQIPVIIKMAFPEFSFDEIQDWTIDKRLQNLARAIHACRMKGMDIDYEPQPEVETEELSFQEKEDLLIKEGKDPMMVLYNEYKTKVTLVKFPFITSGIWNDEELTNAIQRQIKR